MKKYLKIIMLFLEVCLLVGCRAHKETNARQQRTRLDEIGVTSRRLDSLWDSHAESATLRIEYYPKIHDTATASDLFRHSLNMGSSEDGCHGAVKSVEIVIESSSSAATCSVMEDEIRHTDIENEIAEREEVKLSDTQRMATWPLWCAYALFVLLFCFLSYCMMKKHTR